MEAAGRLSQVVCNYILCSFGARVLDYLETQPSRQLNSCCGHFNIYSLNFVFFFMFLSES